MKQIKKNYYILGIDTSCDETSAAITCDTKVLSNVISSQVELHNKFGGVVPMIAKREHQARIEPVIEEAFKRASINVGKNITWNDIDAVAVTYGPGLAIALEVGLLKAKELAKKYDKKFIAVNHMEGHLWSAVAQNSSGNIGLDWRTIKFPVLGLLVSGGHTELALVKDFGEYQIIGETLDDAVGEAYDKVARMLGLGYPGGAVLTEFAKKGKYDSYKLPVPLQNQDTLNMSYSGLKTAVYYLVKDLEQDHEKLSKQEIYDIAASFEASAIKALTIKLELSIKKYKVKSLFVGGGVTASVKVRNEIRKTCRKFGVICHFPSLKNIHMDNGAMIAVAGYFRAIKGKSDKLTIDRNPRADLGRP